MKKFKLSAAVAQILSLGVACSGFACASGEGTPKLPEEPVAKSLSRQNAQVFDSEELDGIDTPEITTPELSSEESEEDDYVLKKSKSINLRADMFLSENGRVLNSLLDELQGVELVEDFPKTTEEFANVLFGRNSEEFLKELESEMSILFKENKTDAAAVMFKIYFMSLNAIY